MAFDGVQSRVACAAMDLQAFAADTLGHLRGKELHHRRFLVAALASVDLLADEIHELPRGLDLGRHVGDLETDRLKVRDRVAELLAVVGVLDRIVERALGKADGTRRGMGAGGLQTRGGVVEGMAFLADQVGGIDTEIVEGQLPGLPTEVADLGNGSAAASLRQLATLLFDEEHGEAEMALAWRRIRSTRDDDHEVGTVGEGAPVLVAADQVAVAVFLRAAGDVGDVGAGIGFRHREGAEELALGHARQIAAALLFAHLLGADQQVAACDDRSDAHPATRQFLGDEAVLGAAEAQAAVLFGDQDAEIAECGHLLAQIHGDLALFGVEFVGDGQDFVQREFARLLLDHAAFFGEERHLYGFLRRTRLVRLKSITSSSRWLKPLVCQVTMPNPLWESEMRRSSTVDSARSESSG